MGEILGEFLVGNLFARWEKIFYSESCVVAKRFCNCLNKLIVTIAFIQRGEGNGPMKPRQPGTPQSIKVPTPSRQWSWKMRECERVRGATKRFSRPPPSPPDKLHQRAFLLPRPVCLWMPQMLGGPAASPQMARRKKKMIMTHLNQSCCCCCCCCLVPLYQRR